MKQRKTDHLEIALKKDVNFKCKTNGLENVDLNYACLPEINRDEVNTETVFMGKKLRAPLMVSAITGGTIKAEKINRDIAQACEAAGVAFGLGSQRAMLEKPGLARTYQVRGVAPSILLFGNIGAVQLKEYSVQEIEDMLDTVKADVLAIHCNAAQEAIQPEGTVDFSGCLDFIDKVSRHLSKPVIIKEVGAGVSKEVAEKISRTNVAAIDVAGAGGTSWTGIEYLRHKKRDGAFWDFGIPTAESIQEVRQVFSGPIIASGGIRTGLDCVKAMSLGASLCGMALPVLKAQAKGGSLGVKKFLQQTIEEIRTAMFLIGVKTIDQIK